MMPSLLPREATASRSQRHPWLQFAVANCQRRFKDIGPAVESNHQVVGATDGGTNKGVFLHFTASFPTPASRSCRLDIRQS